ncbi:MAG: thermonuclease family protein [Bacteroidetes bacterium]|nr:thermonuclease family protein [Bacteroidota bacterium]
MENNKYVYTAYVIDVYDGDSITVDIDLGFGIIMTSKKIRLYGIDAPEIRGDERERGLISKDWLSKKIEGEQIILKTYKDRTGKYGRYLADIYFNGENLNELMLKEGLAEKYGK